MPCNNLLLEKSVYILLIVLSSQVVKFKSPDVAISKHIVIVFSCKSFFDVCMYVKRAKKLALTVVLGPFANHS